jgi:hypothetical protein
MNIFDMSLSLIYNSILPSSNVGFHHVFHNRMLNFHNIFSAALISM